MPTAIKGHIILYEHSDLRGSVRDIFNDSANLGDVDFNDKLSSFVVISGNWKMYQDADFKSEYAPVLGPGIYKTTTEVDIPHDQVSSLRCV